MGLPAAPKRCTSSKLNKVCMIEEDKEEIRDNGVPC